MMKHERINSIMGMTVYTDSGPKIAIGNAHHQVGDLVLTDGRMGGVVFGTERVRNVVPYVATGDYHFADYSALKMYYVKPDFSTIIKTVDIISPDQSAKLLLHCYNNLTEYLVWMWNNGRCLIQKNGETIADFTSVYHAIPEYSDAYIDNDGNLIWVGDVYTDNEAVVLILAKYSNGVLLDSKTYDYSSLISAMQDDIADIVTAAYNDTTITTANNQATTKTTSWSVAPITKFGEIYESHYDCKQAVPDSLYKYAAFYTYIVDLWNLDIFALLAGSGNYQAAIHTAATEYDHFTGAETDVSYISGDYLNLSMSLNRRYKSSDSSIVAEWQNIDPSSTSLTTSHQYSLTDTLTQTGSETINGCVIAGTLTATKLTANISYGTDRIDLAQCVLTFTSGKNAGASRTITLAPGSVGNPWVLPFDSAWDYVPEVGDAFTIDVALATLTEVTTMADFTLATTLSSHIVNESPAISVDLGNGYGIRETLSAIESGYAPEFNWGIDHNSDKVYDGGKAYINMQPSAWCSKSNVFTGLLPGSTTIIRVNGSVATTSDINLFNGNIVTKRFV